MISIGCNYERKILVLGLRPIDLEKYLNLLADFFFVGVGKGRDTADRKDDLMFSIGSLGEFK